MPVARIISLDGGGIKGVISLLILDRLIAEHPSLLEETDVIAGTSAGGLIALAIASGRNVQQLIEIFKTKGSQIFKRQWLHYFGLTGSKYSSKSLEHVVRQTIGGARLEALEKKVVVPTFTLDNRDPVNRCWAPKIYHNFSRSEDGEKYAWEVAMYTSAAPTYFHAFDGHIDGGLIANNPTMAAVTQVLDKRNKPVSTVRKMCVLSIGTGHSNQCIKDPDYSFGKLGVGTIVDIMLDGTEEYPNYQAKVLLEKRLHRIDPVQPHPLALDDVDKINEMIDLAVTCDLDESYKWITNVWAKMK